MKVPISIGSKTFAKLFKCAKIVINQNHLYEQDYNVNMLIIFYVINVTTM